MNKSEVKDLLVQSRKLIQAGWTQGRFDTIQVKPGDGVSYCAIGAMRRIDGLWGESTHVAAKLLCDIIVNDFKYSLPRARLHGWEIVTSWNDQRNRTKEEVVGLFTKAIGKL